MPEQKFKQTTPEPDETKRLLLENHPNSPYFRQLYTRTVLCKEGKAPCTSNTSNCIGTALYLTGEAEKDGYLPIYEIPQLEQLQILETPIVGCLIAWKSNVRGRLDTDHLAVVVSLDPLLVTGRNGWYSDFAENQPFKKVNDTVQSKLSPKKIVYYLPNALKVEAEQDEHLKASIESVFRRYCPS